MSWNAGGSIAGGIVSLTNGAGYPAEIDGQTFAISLVSSGISYPLNIISCCASNAISFEMPAAKNGTAFTLTFSGPANVVTKTYSASTSYTPTANITEVISTLNSTVGNHNITFKATNTYNATILGIKLVSRLDRSYVLPVSSWNTTGTGVNAVTTFQAILTTGSYDLVVSSSPYGYIAMNKTIDV